MSHGFHDHVQNSLSRSLSLGLVWGSSRHSRLLYVASARRRGGTTGAKVGTKEVAMPLVATTDVNPQLKSRHWLLDIPSLRLGWKLGSEQRQLARPVQGVSRVRPSSGVACEGGTRQKCKKQQHADHLLAGNAWLDDDWSQHPCILCAFLSRVFCSVASLPSSQSAHSRACAHCEVITTAMAKGEMEPGKESGSAFHHFPHSR